jgi:23S rRNA (cytidine1920-2'-O)/16S rRNA (cytidine1409-2'-O)-methyltransferase
MRIDILLVEKGFFPSREKAKMAVTTQKVMVNGHIVSKASEDVAEDSTIQVSENQILKYVSLGGLKLEKAIKTFNINFAKKTVLDIGASTGGFTDCALQHGATLVYAVDVGTNQLHHSLVMNEKVKAFEQLNIKDFEIPAPVDVIVIDVSFTSQTVIFPLLKNFFQPKGVLVSLIKPQFELDQKVRFSNGIVTDKKLHLKVVQNIVTSAAENGLFIQNLCVAPAQPNKNTEYLAHFTNYPPAGLLDLKKIINS